MGSERYRFRSTWALPASAAAVFDALRDVESYPRWWPQVRAAVPVDGHGDNGAVTGELHCRSLLPYDLVFTARQELVDPAAGRLRAAFSGDLIGTGEWQISGDGTRAQAVFVEDVEVGKALVRRLGRVARPLLRANHALMMRGGEAGLRAYLG